MIVLLSWHYFSRLWCVYEWAAFLVWHEPRNVRLSVDLMMRPGTIDLYVDSVRSFSVSGAECFNEADRPLLLKKIDAYYNSIEDFEKFVKGTAIALFARFAARPAGRSKNDADDLFMPWVNLAKELGFDRLQSNLLRAEPKLWKEMTRTGQLYISNGPDDCATTHAVATFSRSLTPTSLLAAQTHGESWQGRFLLALESWFEECIVPVLDELRHECVRPELIAERETTVFQV
mmetsp:Transcript_16444/g.29871  ORF Transcript_16444/g.29871 Transcript_16444/m.29871 type:complete len:232 (+) Transcript_16444:2-697(+)